MTITLIILLKMRHNSSSIILTAIILLLSQIGSTWSFSFHHQHQFQLQKLGSTKAIKKSLTPSQYECEPKRVHLLSTNLSSSSTNNDSKKVVDIEAMAKYATAAITQLSLISTFFFIIDQLLTKTATATTLPSPLTWILCYAFSLKSRTFNPLNNARPNRQKAIQDQQSDGFNDRIQPSWTPPGVVFPIMWLLIIGPLRATSSTMIINSLGSYFTLPFMSFMAHLTCGDIWNTINNTEKRYGTSALGIVFVYVSALHAAWQYYQVNALAGKLLGATAIWLSIASALIIQTWRLNGNKEDGGRLESLLPMKVKGEQSKTKFSWFSS